MGQETDQQIRQEFGIYDDKALNEYVNRIGQSMVAQSHRPNLQYHFAVLDTPVVNAFAAPGGYIYVTRGILARFEVTGYQGHVAHVYEMRVFIGGNIPPMTPLKDKLSQDDVNDSDSSKTSLNLTGESAKKSQSVSESQRKSDLVYRLRKIGIFPKTAAQLVAKNDLDRIERFLALYPIALRTKRADGPGWLVTAVINLDWDPDLEQADLEARLIGMQPQAEENQPIAVEAPRVLPAAVLKALRDIGWNGSTAEILESYTQNKRRVMGWLKWAATQPQEYQAARFFNGLRSGLPAPATPRRNPGRYVKGPLGKFIQH